jgi:hypothetical protein
MNMISLQPADTSRSRQDYEPVGARRSLVFRVPDFETQWLWFLIPHVKIIKYK